MPGSRLSVPAATVAHAGAAVIRRVAVQEFVPEPPGRYADTIIEPRHRREVTCHQHALLGPLSLADETDDASGAVITVHPPEAARFAIAVVERCFGTIDAVEVGNPA